ncbi:MAG: FtsX-like permease family protein, partial [Cytophagaceae bacterium]
FFTYIVLPKNYDHKKMEARLPAFIDKYYHFPGEPAGFVGSKTTHLYLWPLTDIHLHSDTTGNLEAGGNIQYVYIFGAIAVFMLLIACINFMNLSTAGASKRGKEVGVRKVLGSLRSSLTTQFLTESLLLTAVSLILAVVLVAISLPFFDDLTGKELSLNLLKTPWLVPAILLLGTLVGLLAGSYPAFFLSSFKPIVVLKGGTPFSRAGKSGVGVRSGLVVFQFFIAMLLMVGTMVVYQQLNFIQHTKLGYDKDQVLVLRDAWRLGKKEAVFRQEVEQDSRVANVSVSGYLPAGPTNNNNFILYADDNSSKLITTLRYDIDGRYIPTMGMKLVAG